MPQSDQDPMKLTGTSRRNFLKGAATAGAAAAAAAGGVSGVTRVAAADAGSAAASSALKKIGRAHV